MWFISTYDFELMPCHHSCSEDNTEVNTTGQSLYVVYSQKIDVWLDSTLIMLNLNKLLTVVVIQLVKDQDFLWIPFSNFNRTSHRKLPYSLLPLSKEGKDNQPLPHVQLLNNCVI